MLGVAGALVLNSAVLCTIGFAVFVFERLTRESRARSAPSVDVDASLAVPGELRRR
jgi:hypothetical protein